MPNPWDDAPSWEAAVAYGARVRGCLLGGSSTTGPGAARVGQESAPR
ncbi:hypothetical protein [Streptomyces sp. NPDC017941]